MPDGADLVLDGGGVKGIALVGVTGRQVIPRLNSDGVSIARYAHQASTAAQATAPAAVGAKPAAVEAKPAALGASAAAREPGPQ